MHSKAFGSASVRTSAISCCRTPRRSSISSVKSANGGAGCSARYSVSDSRPSEGAISRVVSTAVAIRSSRTRAVLASKT